MGFVAGYRTRRLGCHGELQWVNVARESRGWGIRAMLVRKIGFWFADQGARRICVAVEPDNAIARGLYSRCGAKPFKPCRMIGENARDMVAEPSPEYVVAALDFEKCWSESLQVRAPCVGNAWSRTSGKLPILGRHFHFFAFLDK